VNKFLPVVEHLVEVYKKWYLYYDHLPKKSRPVLGREIDCLFIQLLTLLFTAGYEKRNNKLLKLEKAIKKIDILKFFLRIAWEIKALDNKKYIALSKEVLELGRMVGGWRKGLLKKLPQE